MSATLKNLKNKHLLVVIAILCAGNVLACLALVFGEQRTTRGVADLRLQHVQDQDELNNKLARFTSDLAALQQQHVQDRDEFTKELARLSKRMDEQNQQQAQAIECARKDLQASIDQIKERLRPLQEFAAKLQERKWLTCGKPEDVPWGAELWALKRRLAAAEMKLQRIPVPEEIDPRE